jgi:uncharacterized lipoprotein YehR (DUF1307 family)
MNRKKLFSLIALMLAMVMIFAGCSKKEETKAQGTGTNSGKPVEITFGGTEQLNMASGQAATWFVDS